MRSIGYFPVLTFIALLLTGSLRGQQQPDTVLLHFSLNSWSLRPNDTRRLDSFMQRPSAARDSLFFIGYTDTLGASDYNYRLSTLRAIAAAHYIQRLFYIRRIFLVPVNISGKGEEDPAAGDDSLSRRVLVIARHPGRDNPSASLASKPAPAPEPTKAPEPVPATEPATATQQLPAADRQPDTVVSLTNINFIEDSPNLTAASRMALPAYIRALQQYKGDFIEIDGYCNSFKPITSTSDPLFRLSVQRAKLIYDYLLDEGFDAAKLSYKGMGNASSIDAHPTTSAAARSNMRVEIHIFHKPRKEF